MTGVLSGLSEFENTEAIHAVNPALDVFGERSCTAAVIVVDQASSVQHYACLAETRH
jgi:hypothetical protein